jgi:8-oxo-dGTP pyrophosphatase MutT (NUDIX family)
MDCAYRFHAVQDEQFDIGVRPLGTKGITIREGRVLMGQRTNSVCSYPGLWEFAPSGVVEIGSSPGHNIAAELREETGLEPAREPTPVALLYDDVLRCWEIVFRIEPGPGEPRRSTSTCAGGNLMIFRARSPRSRGR